MGQMQELIIEQSKNTPKIYLNPSGIIKMQGRSIHEDVMDFFTPVKKWINEYVANPAQLTTVDLNFEYCNSTSSKMLIYLLQQIMSVNKQDKSFVINWYYEEGDDDIFERGEYFASILNVPINIIKITGE